MHRAREERVEEMLPGQSDSPTAGIPERILGTRIGLELKGSASFWCVSQVIVTISRSFLGLSCEISASSTPGTGLEAEAWLWP